MLADKASDQQKGVLMDRIILTTQAIKDDKTWTEVEKWGDGTGGREGGIRV